MDFTDKLGLLVMVGLTGGSRHQCRARSGPYARRTRASTQQDRVSPECATGHFFVEHNRRAYHVRVATVRRTRPTPDSARVSTLSSPARWSGAFASCLGLQATRSARMDKSAWTFSNDVLNAWALSILLFSILFGLVSARCLPALAYLPGDRRILSTGNSQLHGALRAAAAKTAQRALRRGARVLEFYGGDIRLAALKPRDAERLSAPSQRAPERQPAPAPPWIRSVGRMAGGRVGERVLVSSTSRFGSSSSSRPCSSSPPHLRGRPN